MFAQVNTWVSHWTIKCSLPCCRIIMEINGIWFILWHCQATLSFMQFSIQLKLKKRRQSHFSYERVNKARSSLWNLYPYVFSKNRFSRCNFLKYMIILITFHQINTKSEKLSTTHYSYFSEEYDNIWWVLEQNKNIIFFKFELIHTVNVLVCILRICFT